MTNIVRIGSRESQLALQQAETVSKAFSQRQYDNIIIGIKSDGDINRTTPIYQMGIQGVFTKSLDIALLNNDIDIAVHSFKDIPTQVAEGLCIVAVLPRTHYADILVLKKYQNEKDFYNVPRVVATGSLRRQAQWKYRYPTHQFEPIRGNIQTRLNKLDHSIVWDGVVFSEAAIDRLQLFSLLQNRILYLPWMLPAPAQGAIAIMCRENDEKTIALCATLHHQPSYICTAIERKFLQLTEAGCSSPIGALAQIKDQMVHLFVCVTSPDGTDEIRYNIQALLSQWESLAQQALEMFFEKGGNNFLI